MELEQQVIDAERISIQLKSWAQEVFENVGTGCSESMYQEAMKVCLQDANIKYATEQVIPVMFRQRQIGFVRADLVVLDDPVYVIELKAVGGTFRGIEINQLRSYLKRTDINFGFLINFPQPGAKAARTEIDLQVVYLNAPTSHESEDLSLKKTLDLKSI